MDSKSPAPQTKGAVTRQKILARAYELSGEIGLTGLTIGELATDLQLSKSGLFSHFGSKEHLQIAVLECAALDFEHKVFRPALIACRGLPRLVALFENWMKWIDGHDRRGCVFLSAAIDFDDRDGPVREAIAAWFSRADAMLARAFALAADEGHLPRGIDCVQLADEFHGILLKYHLNTRLLRVPDGETRARKSFTFLLNQFPESH